MQSILLWVSNMFLDRRRGQKVTHEDIIIAVTELKDTLDKHVITSTERMMMMERESGEKKIELREIRQDGQYIRDKVGAIEKQVAVLSESHDRQKAVATQTPMLVTTTVVTVVAVLLTGLISFGMYLLQGQAAIKQQLLEQLRQEQMLK